MNGYTLFFWSAGYSILESMYVVFNFLWKTYNKAKFTLTYILIITEMYH